VFVKGCADVRVWHWTVVQKVLVAVLKTLNINTVLNVTLIVQNLAVNLCVDHTVLVHKILKIRNHHFFSALDSIHIDVITLCI
jgi:hypothetical protein